MPITRIVKVGDVEMKVSAVAQLPPGAVPAFLGLILIVAVLIEPWLIRRKASARLWARLRGLPPPPAPEIGGVAIEGVSDPGQRRRHDQAMSASGWRRLLTRRDSRRGA